MKRNHSLASKAKSILPILALLTIANSLFAQGTAFTYQGLLNSNGMAINGIYDIQFGAYDAAANGNLLGSLVTNSAVSVSNGLFTTTIDLGSGVFTGSPVWLDIAVTTNGDGNFVELSSRQHFTPSPYAIFSSSSGAAATADIANSVASGTISATELNTAGTPTAGQVLGYSGSQLVWQDPVVGGSTGGWSLTGNLGTSPSLNFLGTLDSQPLELKVGGVRGLRIEPTGSSYPNVIGGGPSNFASNGVVGGVVGGGINNIAGGQQTVVGGGYQNKAGGYISSVLGGAYNTASSNEAVVVGGDYNTASGAESFIGSGTQNTASGNDSVIGGGVGNVASGNSYWFLYNSDFSSAGSGYGSATVGGGSGNSASGAGATIPGGLQNVATGTGSLAAGSLSHAVHDGTFVWTDYAAFGGTFSSLAANQFLIRAGGGVGIGTAQTPPGGLRVASGGLAVTGGSSPNYTGSAGVFIEKAGGVGAMFAYDYVNSGPLALGLNSPGGNVGIGTLSPPAKLTVHDSVSVSHRIETTGGVNAWTRVEFANANGQWNIGTSRGYNGDQLYFSRQGVTANALALQPSGDAAFSGNVSVCTLTIRGGCDLAEPFATTEPEIEKGSVVVIDAEHPGKLKLSNEAYDTKVAGIISGANGINPGIALHQEGVLEAGQNVALSGRVYVQADADSGAIEPGDLLTTSSTPGHAMKVLDHSRAQGAVIGKAMTSLHSGKGMVLVLVSLQ